MTAYGIFNRMPGLTLEEATSVLGRRWGWLLAAGIAYIPLGIFALLMPVASTIGLTFALAGIFLASGIIQLVHAVKLRHEQGAVMRFLQSLLALVSGGIIFWLPGIGMLGITLTLAFYFFISAALQWILASSLAPKSSRTWPYLSSVASFILGVYIIWNFPLSALWVPGTLLGIEFLFSGFGLIGFALNVRSLNRESQGIEAKPKPSPASAGLQPSGQPT